MKPIYKKIECPLCGHRWRPKYKKDKYMAMYCSICKRRVNLIVEVVKESEL